MKFKHKKDLPFGILLLCIFYIINALLFISTTLLFLGYIDVIIFGKIMANVPVVFVRFLLTIFPVYLAFGLYYLRKEAWFLTIFYHLFFIINGVLTISYLLSEKTRLRPIFEIAIKSEYKIQRIHDLFGITIHLYLVQTLGVAISLFIIIYLSTKRKIFTF